MRAVLGARRSSLFLTPSRAVLEAQIPTISTALAVELTGQGISRQSYGLRTKIFEVEQWVPNSSCPIHEAHPEVSFTLMMGAPARHSKKTWGGMVERRDALDRAGIVLDQITPDAQRYAAVDDMFDAAALAWTARRVHEGTAESFPATPETSADGTTHRDLGREQPRAVSDSIHLDSVHLDAVRLDRTPP